MSKNVCPADQDPAFLERRRCFRDPIKEIFRAAELLSEAVDAHLAGDRRNAGRLIAEADMYEVQDWTESICGKGNSKTLRVGKEKGTRQSVCCDERDPKREASKDQVRALIKRDRRHCRFCGIPLICADTRKAIHECYQVELRWGDKNCEQHAAFQCMWMQFDHVLAHSRGGRTNLDNLILTCGPCNWGKGNRTLEEVGLIDPRTRSETKPTWKGYATWDGLERFKGC